VACQFLINELSLSSLEQHTCSSKLQQSLIRALATNVHRYSGAGVRILPGVCNETPVLQIASAADKDVLILDEALQAVTQSVGTMTLNPDDTCHVASDSGNSVDSTPMPLSRTAKQHTQPHPRTQHNSVRFSQVESVALTGPSPSPLSTAAEPLLQSQIQHAGRTPYSVQPRVSFSEQAMSMTQQMPEFLSNQEHLLGSESSQGEEATPLQEWRSLNAGATPRHCGQVHVTFNPVTLERTPDSFQGSTLPETPDAENVREPSLEESRRLSMNAGCTPGAGYLTRDLCTEAITDADEATLVPSGVSDNMQTDECLIAGALHQDASIRAPVAAARNHAAIATGPSSALAHLTFKSDAAQSTAAADPRRLALVDTDGPISALLPAQYSTVTPAVCSPHLHPGPIKSMLIRSCLMAM
jgi:hypothetical protein